MYEDGMGEPAETPVEYVTGIVTVFEMETVVYDVVVGAGVDGAGAPGTPEVGPAAG